MTHPNNAQYQEAWRKRRAQEVQELRDRVAALEAENAKLKAQLADRGNSSSGSAPPVARKPKPEAKSEPPKRNPSIKAYLAEKPRLAAVWRLQQLLRRSETENANERETAEKLVRKLLDDWNSQHTGRMRIDVRDKGLHKPIFGGDTYDFSGNWLLLKLREERQAKVRPRKGKTVDTTAYDGMFGDTSGVADAAEE